MDELNTQDPYHQVYSDLDHVNYFAKSTIVFLQGQKLHCSPKQYFVLSCYILFLKNGIHRLFDLFKGSKTDFGENEKAKVLLFRWKLIYK
jgi:hypothetical protein